MFDIFNQALNIAQAITSLIDMLIWVISGLDDIIELLGVALRSFTKVVSIFPANVGEALMGVCGGLFVLRVFGRS